MAKGKIEKRGRRKVSTSLSEAKTLRLFREGSMLLASADFEQISIAKFAKAANISVGAFYVRFTDKDRFLDFITLHTFSMAEERFRRACRSIGSHPSLADELVEELVSQFADREFAGVVRMAVKRGLSDANCRRPFDAYRLSVSNYIMEMVPERTEQERKADIETALIATLGVLTDAAIIRTGDVSLNRVRLRSFLVDLLSDAIGKLKLRTPATNKSEVDKGRAKV